MFLWFETILFSSANKISWPPVGNQHRPHAECDDDKNLETVKGDTLDSPKQKSHWFDDGMPVDGTERLDHNKNNTVV